MSLLILGLMLSYAVGSVVSILMFYSFAEEIRSFYFWSYGSFASVTWQQMAIFAPALACALAATVFLAKPLDAFLLGEDYARSMGVRVGRCRFWILAAGSLLAGTVTGFCGPIGFLGIAAPHLCRFLYKTADHRVLLPACAVLGAIIALLADLAARLPGMSGSLPLNSVTALLGAPVVIAALLRQRNFGRLFS